MTTNQTIDGVPRELLVRLLEVAAYSASAPYRELRALLDAPAKLDLVECDACPTSGGCVSVCMKAPNSAEQPQGEPVAMVRTHGSECWEEITGESLEMCKAQPEEYEVRMLYSRPAEQPAPVAFPGYPPVPEDRKLPAPVAVVLPERNKASQNLDLEQCGYVDGWNACLDEVARLNTK